MSTLGLGTQCYIINEVSATGTTPRVSSVVWLQHSRIVSFQLVTTGTIAGAWKVEVSNDYSGAGGSAFMQPPNDGNWTTITTLFSPTIAAVISGGSNQYTEKAPLGARVVRVTFTPSAGTGNIQAIVSGGEY